MEHLIRPILVNSEASKSLMWTSLIQFNYFVDKLFGDLLRKLLEAEIK